MTPSQAVEQSLTTDCYHTVALTLQELHVLEEILDHTLSETKTLINYYSQVSTSEELANSQGYSLLDAASLFHGARQKEEHIKNIRHEVTQLLSDLNDQ